MKRIKLEQRLLSLTIAGLLAGGVPSFAQAQVVDTITGVDTAATAGTPEVPTVDTSTFTVGVQDSGGNAVGDFTWDYATASWSTTSGFTPDATNGNVFIGTFNGNLSVVTLPPDGPGAPGNPPTAGQPNSGIVDPTLSGSPTLDPGATPNSALNTINAGDSNLWEGPATVTSGAVVSTGAIASDGVNFTTPDISYTFDDTVDNTRDNISTVGATVAPPVPATVQSGADQINIQTNLEVRSVNQGFEA
ncbi:MAG: hypothetical protein RL434_2897, partial [Pseudomonadota bacterium]